MTALRSWHRSARCGRGAAALLGALLAAGCSSVSVPSLPTYPKPAAVGRTVTVEVDRSGKEVMLALDQDLVVRLAADPTRGYRWLRDAPTDPGGVLTAVGKPGFERESWDKNAFENAGYDTFRFRPNAAGQQTLRFEYRREGAVAMPADVVWYLVTVR